MENQNRKKSRGLFPPIPFIFDFRAEDVLTRVTRALGVIKEIDKRIYEADNIIKSIDDYLQSDVFSHAEELFAYGSEDTSESPKRYTGETKSYEGQSDESYCAECLVSHYSTVYGLLEEAYRLSINEDKLNNESLNRVKEALKELKTSLYDLGSVKTDWTDEFRSKVRELRKKYLLPILADPSRKDLLKDAMEYAKSLFDRAVEVLQQEKQRESLGETLSGDDVEREMERALTYFINKKDIQFLEKAYRLSFKSGCPACTKYLAAALDAAREGRIDEAIEWAQGVRRGIRVILYGKE